MIIESVFGIGFEKIDNSDLEDTFFSRGGGRNPYPRVLIGLSWRISNSIDPYFALLKSALQPHSAHTLYLYAKEEGIDYYYI